MLATRMRTEDMLPISEKLDAVNISNTCWDSGAYLSSRYGALIFALGASALDPIATAKIEDLIRILVKNYTVVIVTHNMQQILRRFI